MSDPILDNINIPLPLVEGLAEIGRYHVNDLRRANALLKLKEGWTLRDLMSDFAFFTHGALFTHGGFPFDPSLDYFKDRPSYEQPFTVDLREAVFAGLDAVGDQGVIRSEWNARLCCVRREVADPFFRFMQTVGMINREYKYVCATDLWHVPVVDVADMARKQRSTGDNVPFVPVLCVGLNTNFFAARFYPATSGDRLSRMKLIPPDPQFVAYANEILAESPKPAAGTIEPTFDQAVENLKASRDEPTG